MSHSPDELWVELERRRSDPRREVILPVHEDGGGVTPVKHETCGFVSGEEEGPYNQKFHPPPQAGEGLLGPGMSS